MHARSDVLAFGSNYPRKLRRDPVEDEDAKEDRTCPETGRPWSCGVAFCQYPEFRLTA